MPRLIMLRHGQSTWNDENLFTGWVDVPLNERGTNEATQAGKLMIKHDCLPDIVHTSLLRRAITTANLALDNSDRHWIPVKRAWELNERHYGGLQGKNKKQAAEKFGDEQVHKWRRSYDIQPPENEQSAKEQDPDGRYARGGINVPKTECLKDVLERALPYWEKEIVPDLKSGNTVLIAAHGNSLRALTKELEGISDEEIPGLEIPTGVPILYELDDNMKPKDGAKGKHLD